MRSRSPALRTRPFQHLGGAEQRADGAHVLRLALEREHRRARRDPQPFDLRQRVDQLVGDAVAQILVFGVGARVDERKHGDRAREQPGRGEPRERARVAARRGSRATLAKRSAGSLASACASARSSVTGSVRTRASAMAVASPSRASPSSRGVGTSERRLAGQHLVARRTPGCRHRSRTPRSRSPLACSGLMYSGVPSAKPTAVSASLPSVAQTCATPKSASRACPSAKRMFSGFTSRCTNPFRCA